MTRHLQSLPQIKVSVGEEDASKARAAVPSEIPAAPAKLSARERKVWNYISQALHEYGLVHRTDALVLAVICKTFVRWTAAEEKLDQVIAENNGNYMVVTPNGYAQPHQAFYVARGLKKELLQWLPEAALTIPSFMKAVVDTPAGVQGNLFEDPVETFQNRRPVPMRAL